MRKEILISNYHPIKIKELRIIADIKLEELESYDIDQAVVQEIEQSAPVLPVDIFYLAFLYITYKTKAEELGKEKLPSLTSDILFPHPDGLNYQEFIASHPNYVGLPIERKNNNQIKWVATIKTKKGKERIDFWERKRLELNIGGNGIMDPGLRQKVAYALHPTKQHTCLYSGTVLYLDYRYLSPSKTDKLNKDYGHEFKYYDLDIYEIANYLYPIDKAKSLCKVIKLNSTYNSLNELNELLKLNFVDKEYSPYVSPGAMSNSPDRLDGYHSYNADVRELADTGRNKDNLKKYTQDRRVYEMWSDGNWKKADRLYATFAKNGVSPDHIGPMSLGFAHRPKFQPMTSSENSSKGNRMSFNDVKTLIDDENNGAQVISWHSKAIWDKLKNNVRNDEDAVKLSALMRANLHHVLIILSIINENGHRNFLLNFLNPEYSYFDYTFHGFNPQTGTFDSVSEKELRGQNQKNNAERYIRIAFETLEKYQDKDNRKTKKWSSNEVDNLISNVIEELNKGNFNLSEKLLNQVFILLSNLASLKW